MEKESEVFFSFTVQGRSQAMPVWMIKDCIHDALKHRADFIITENDEEDKKFRV